MARWPFAIVVLNPMTSAGLMMNEKKWAKQLRNEIASCIRSKNVTVDVGIKVPYKFEVLECGKKKPERQTDCICDRCFDSREASKWPLETEGCNRAKDQLDKQS